MSLRDKILKQSVPASGSAQPAPKRSITPLPAGESVAASTPSNSAGSSSANEGASYQSTKIAIHKIILERVELDKLNRLSPEQIKLELAQLVEVIIGEQKILMNEIERRRLVQDVQDEMLGLGPLEALLNDPTVSDILVNNPRQTFVERSGKLQLSNVVFNDDAHLLKIIERIVSRVGRRIDESSPMVDARLADGSRVNAVIPPSAIDGPCISIRRFPSYRLGMSDLVSKQSITQEMANALQAAVRAKMNVVISGGTGSGKTTLLNLLSASIGPTERVLTIEDAAELALQQIHVLRLETRPPNVEGKGEVSQRDLVRNALRMRPDRIVLGEVRGPEALDMLNAMNTGHDGSLATLHANTPRDALVRLENMVSMASNNLPMKALRYQIASAVNLVVQVSRLSDGSRRIMSITEITGMEGDTISTQEIFKFVRTGADADGKVRGYFCATGVRPKFYEHIIAFGLSLPEDTFNPEKRLEV
jgi:pilus assembly protein CpaF